MKLDNTDFQKIINYSVKKSREKMFIIARLIKQNYHGNFIIF